MPDSPTHLSEDRKVLPFHPRGAPYTYDEISFLQKRQTRGSDDARLA